MIIDSKIETAKTRMTFVIVLFLSLVAMTLSFFDLEYNPFLFPAGVALLLYYAYMHFLQLYYVYFSDHGDKITLRFYYAHPFMRKYRAIEIPKSSLVGAEFQTSFFNLKTKLILSQKTAKGVVKYPAVSLSLLNSKKKSEIEKALRKLLENTGKQPVQKPKGKYY